MWARHGWVPRGACWGRLGSDGLPRCWNARAVCTWITLRAQRTREVGRGARNYWQGRGTGARRWRSLLWQRCCSRRATAPIEACRVSLNRQVSEWVVRYFARSLRCLSLQRFTRYERRMEDAKRRCRVGGASGSQTAKMYIVSKQSGLHVHINWIVLRYLKHRFIYVTLITFVELGIRLW